MYIGDFPEDYATLNYKFTTRTTAGVPFALASGTISVYESNSVTQITAGVTLTPDFDGVTGLNNVLIDLSASALYAVNKDYYIVITVGTVNSVSVVGEVVGSFSIERAGGAIALLATAQADLDIITGAAGVVLDADAITSAKIADDAIAAEHLATGAIVAATFAANAITSTVVADNTITAAKINADAITSAKIADNAFLAVNFGADFLTSAKIADDAITTDHIATGALTADSFAADALAAATFATGAFTADAFAADALVAATFATGAFTADAYAADAFVAATFATDSITADAIAAAAITATEFTAINSTALTAISSQYDGTGLTGDTYPATQAAVGNISSGSASINTTANSDTTVTTGNEVLTYTATTQLDGSVHEVNPDGGNTEFYYEFDVTSNGVPVSITWNGYANSNGDAYTIKALNWPATYETVGTIPGSIGSTVITETFDLTNAHVGTGADLGKVRFQVTSADGTGFNTDRILCAYAIVNQSVGYANGSIWVDTVNGTDAQVAFVNGVADNPCKTWANVKALITSTGLSSIQVVNGSAITLDANSDNLHFVGEGWTLALGSQSIASTYAKGAIITGISSGTGFTFDSCSLGAVSLGAGTLKECGIGLSSGTFTAIAGSGDYVFERCFSVVPGSGTPVFTFAPVTGATGINNRGWFGGANYTLDTNCTLTHEVAGGGGTTVTPADGDVEIRGLCRAVTLALSDTDVGNTMQVIANTGPVTITSAGSGDSATINLYGTTSGVTDGSSGGTTVTDSMVSNTSINAEADTALSDYDGPTNTEMEARTPTAAQLAYIVANAATGMPVTFTTAGGGVTTAVLNQVDGAAASATADQYNGRLLVFTDGTLKGVVTDITDYDGSDVATITAIPFAPTSSHNARLI